MAIEPWAEGPGEILLHGLEHLERDGDTDRRLAMISIDNSVELMIKTYLDMPKRSGQGPVLSQRERREIGDGFNEQLDALERYGAEKLEGVDLGLIEYYHRLRNQLYHQGNGLTVERSKVEVYGEVARLLFKNLFGQEPVLPAGLRTGEDLVWKYISEWRNFSSWVQSTISPHVPFKQNTWWDLEGVLPPELSKRMLVTRSRINSVSHGDASAVESLTVDHIQELRRLRADLESHFGIV